MWVTLDPDPCGDRLDSAAAAGRRVMCRFDFPRGPHSAANLSDPNPLSLGGVECRAWRPWLVGLTADVADITDAKNPAISFLKRCGIIGPAKSFSTRSRRQTLVSLALVPHDMPCHVRFHGVTPCLVYHATFHDAPSVVCSDLPRHPPRGKPSCLEI